MRKALRYMHYRKSFSPCSGLHYHYFMGGVYLIVRCLLRNIIYLTTIDHTCPLDNLGLMPYRRRIVSVSKWSLILCMMIHLYQSDRILSWKPDTCNTVWQTNTRRNHVYSKIVHRGVDTVRPSPSTVIQLLLLNMRLDSIWNTYKDEFAKARTRELNIVDWSKHNGQIVCIDIGDVRYVYIQFYQYYYMGNDKPTNYHVKW